jgi:hypothetical protein
LQRSALWHIKTANALQLQLLGAGVEGDQQRSSGFFVAQHRHVARLGSRAFGQPGLQTGNLLRGIVQATGGLQGHHDSRCGGKGPHGRRALPQRDALPPGRRRRLAGTLAQRGAFGLYQVVDAGPDGSRRRLGRLQFGQARPVALPQERGGAHGGVLARHRFKPAARTAAQRTERIAGRQLLQQLGVLVEVHLAYLTRSGPCIRAIAPGRAGSRF